MRCTASPSLVRTLRILNPFATISTLYLHWSIAETRWDKGFNDCMNWSRPCLMLINGTSVRITSLRIYWFLTPPTSKVVHLLFSKIRLILFMRSKLMHFSAFSRFKASGSITYRDISSLSVSFSIMPFSRASIQIIIALLP